jgi:uncharacterized heparinase superfamily protein
MRRAMGLSRARRVARPDQMNITLPDLRAADPMFAQELTDGRVALSSGLLTIGHKGAFDSAIATDAMRRELFGFSWLRHLHVARTPHAEDLARRHLLAWSRSTARRLVIAHEPAVAARRALSFFSHADVALSGASARDFDNIMDLVSDDIATLSDAAPRMPMAQPRLTALIALAAYHVCSGTTDAAARQGVERRLSAELDRQILADGGHLSRSPAALLELALDLVPLQRAYLTARATPPKALGSALTRLRGMLDLLSHGDQHLGRFNGMGATALTDLAMVLKSLPTPDPTTTATSRSATDTGYIRLANADALVLFDIGPGAETLAGEAPFAGALSFEFSAGRAPLIVNCGSDHGLYSQPRLEVRATASHSALVLGSASSAPATGARGGSSKGVLEKGPGDEALSTIRASTDGYRQRFGFVHHRTLALLRDGWLLEGADRLEAQTGASADVAFDIRFHLHPTVYVEADAQRQTLRLTAADGSRWAMTLSGAEVLIEPSTYYAGASSAKPTLQIVLKGRATGTTEVTWRFERMSPAAVS